MKTKYKKQFVYALVILFLIAALLLVYFCFTESSSDSATPSLGGLKKETLIIWYTDDALTEFLNNRALAFYDETDIRVETKLVSGLEYLEEINRTSIYEQDKLPDIYILTNDSLEKAYLAGLAADISDSGIVTQDRGFCSAAVNAVTYKDKILGCPFYFETSALLYNKTYLEQIAAQTNEAYAASENAGAAAENAGASGENADASEDAGVRLTAEDLIPSTIADILNISDTYSMPENAEYFFRWDVSDIFYNYFIVGNYITVGGEAGDDKNSIDIYNEDSIGSLEAYRQLSQFFSIDIEETSYESILQEFIDGKTVYTIATSDCIDKLGEAAQDGRFPYEYGITKLPDINSGLATRGMSVTDALVVNGYSRHKESAVRLVRYLSENSVDSLYAMAGKVAALPSAEYADSHMEAFMRNYALSAPMPKMVETSNFWIELETCLERVWGGEEPNEQLKALSEKIKSQLAGEQVSEQALDSPDVKLINAVEYEDSGETSATTE